MERRGRRDVAEVGSRMASRRYLGATPIYEYHFITFLVSRKNKNSGGQVSDRSTAVLATPVLHDLGLVSPIDRSKVIDQSKVRRERRKNRNELQLNGEQFDHYGIEGIFFDGRKDQTLTQVLGIDNKYHRKTLTE